MCHIFLAMCAPAVASLTRADSDEKLYTYSIITTESNKQLQFLHDRMPVILENGSEEIRTWLDPNRTSWGHDLQALLKPFTGELECYPVSKDVGKVGNNSPSFVVPINSAANKNNIANFFGNQQKAATVKKEEGVVGKSEHGFDDGPTTGEIKVEYDVNEARETTNRLEGSENNAPLPVPAQLRSPVGTAGIKRERSDNDGDTAAGTPQQKRRASAMTAAADSPSRKKKAAKKGTRSATSNGSAAKASAGKGDGSRKITSFFTK